MTSLFWVAALLSFIELGCGPCDQIGWFSVIKVSVLLPSDAILQYLPSNVGFCYCSLGVSLHGCSSKAQPLLLTLDEVYLLTATTPDLKVEQLL